MTKNFRIVIIQNFTVSINQLYEFGGLSLFNSELLIFHKIT